MIGSSNGKGLYRNIHQHWERRSRIGTGGKLGSQRAAQLQGRDGNRDKAVLGRKRSSRLQLCCLFSSRRPQRDRCGTLNCVLAAASSLLLATVSTGPPRHSMLIARWHTCRSERTIRCTRGNHTSSSSATSSPLTSSSRDADPQSWRSMHTSALSGNLEHHRTKETSMMKSLRG